MPSLFLDENLNYHFLSDNLKQIKIMKGILNINSEEKIYTLNELHKQLDEPVGWAYLPNNNCFILKNSLVVRGWMVERK